MKKYIRNWASAGFVSLTLLAAGSLYSTIGMMNAFNALMFASQVIGVLILLSGIVIFLSGIAVLPIQLAALRQARKTSNASLAAVQAQGENLWEESRAPATRDLPILRSCALLVMAGIVLSLLVSVAILIIQLRIYEPTRWVIAWGTIAAASALALYLAIRANLPVSISVKGLLGGLSVAALVPIVGFVYTAFYLPSAAPANLTISATLSKASTDEVSHSARIPFTITISNPQKVGVYLLAAYYDMIGRSGRVSQVESSQFYTNEDNAAAYEQPIRRFVGGTSSALVQEGSILPAGFFIQPGGSYTFGGVAAIPVPTSYDEIQLDTDLIVMRNDRVTLDPDFGSSTWPSWDSSGQNVPAPDWVLSGLPYSQHYVKWQGRLETGYLQGLISSPKVVTVWYVLPSITGNVIPYIVSDVSTEGEDSRVPTPHEEQANFRRYGLATMFGNNITESVIQLSIRG